MRIGAGGAAPVAAFVPMDPTGQYRDGPNLYQYVGGNPVARLDPYGLAWTTRDFVWHYYFGDGQGVTLGGIGLLGTFQNAQSVKNSVADFKDNVVKKDAADKAKGMDCCKEKSINIIGKKNAVTDVTKEIYSVGHSTFFRSYDCTLKATECDGKTVKKWSYDCTLSFGIRDWFKDPLDIGIEVDGTPYKIDADWTEAYSCAGP